jgi:4-hydroxythreonine-4-phosphate dehydrogenase
MPRRVGIVADDLTGAADTAVAFLQAPMPASVRFSRPDLVQEFALIRAGAIALDSGTRRGSAASAESAVSEWSAAFRLAGFDILYKKIDSLLRGHVAAEVRAAMRGWAASSVALVAPAFPAVGRTTRGGRLMVDGRATPAAPAIADLFAGTAGVSTIELDAVRDTTLPGHVREASARASVIVCDAETDADLARIVQAGLAVDQPLVWVGSGGLAQALAREMREPVPASPIVCPRVCGPILAVVGSLTDIARSQARRLAAEGVTHVPVSPDDIVGMALPLRVDAALSRATDVLVTIEGGSPSGGEGDARLVAELGAALAPSVRRHVGGLLLTGGDTATGMLRALDCRGLDLVGEVEPGVVLASTAGTRAWPVITKSGSFGQADTLANALRTLRGMRD